MTTKKDAHAVKHNSAAPGRHVHARNVVPTRTLKKKEESLPSMMCAWLVEHQIGVSVNLLLLLTLAHICFPRARSRTRKFFELSYYDPDTQFYGRGNDDLPFVFFWIVVFTGLRVAIMEYILKPFARWAGIESRKATVRFAEQGWAFLYALVFWSYGMHIFYNSSYWGNLAEMWKPFPTTLLSAKVKFYYLVQFAFWLQQLYVVNIEERRKDHWQMFTHHIFTSSLIFTSYGFYQTNVGTVILCIFDIGDILLPFAKLLNYLDLRMACDITFGLFMVVWFFTRHLAYIAVNWSLLEAPKHMAYGCYTTSPSIKPGTMIAAIPALRNNYISPVAPANIASLPVVRPEATAILTNMLQPFLRPGEQVCLTPEILNVFLVMLTALQILTILWFAMIIKVAYGVISGKGAQDNRSDVDSDEELDTLDDVAWEKGAEPIEQVVGADALHYNMSGRASASGSSNGGSSRTRSRRTPLSIPGHGDRKELLGRIGCDKPT